MVDSGNQDVGNISLPAKLQSYSGENDAERQPKDKPTIINMQRTFYNIRLEDIENKIDRLETRNDELIEEIETVDEDTVTVDADTAEEIGNLSKRLLSQEDAVKSLKIKIKTVENDRVKDRESLERAIELFNQKYRKKKVELVSEIKCLNAAINILEDFKKVQAALEEKLKTIQQQIINNEENVKEILENIQRRIEFDKEMLKNDMYECLLGLAADFQLETSKYISLPNQRLIRENVMLKNELLQTSETVSSKLDVQIYLKNAATEYQKKIQKRLSAIKRNTITNKVQNEVLARLKKRYRPLQQRFLSLDLPDHAAEERYSMLVGKAQRERGEADFRLSKLKTLLHKDRTKVNNAKYVLKKLECKIKAAVETIYDLKYTVICLLKYPNSRKDLMKLNCMELFVFLRETFDEGRSKLGSFAIKSLESIPRELDSDTDLRKIQDDFDFEVMAKLTEEESSTKDVLGKTDLDKTEISTESEEQLVRGAVLTDESTSVESTIPESYEFYGEDEFEGEFNATDE